MKKYHLTLIAAIALPMFNGFAQSVVSPVTVAMTVSTAGESKDTVDKNENLTKSVTRMGVSKISNATILKEMKLNGDITTTSGYSLVMKDGGFVAYSKANGEAGVPYGFECSYGEVPSPAASTYSATYDAEGSMKTETTVSSGVKMADFNGISGAGVIKVTMDKNGNVFESGDYKFLASDGESAFEGKVTVGAGKLVTE